MDGVTPFPAREWSDVYKPEILSMKPWRIKKVRTIARAILKYPPHPGEMLGSCASHHWFLESSYEEASSRHDSEDRGSGTDWFMAMREAAEHLVLTQLCFCEQEHGICYEPDPEVVEAMWGAL